MAAPVSHRFNVVSTETSRALQPTLRGATGGIAVRPIEGLTAFDRYKEYALSDSCRFLIGLTNFQHIPAPNRGFSNGFSNGFG